MHRKREGRVIESKGRERVNRRKEEESMTVNAHKRKGSGDVLDQKACCSKWKY